jgi:hypothetical protein
VCLIVRHLHPRSACAPFCRLQLLLRQQPLRVPLLPLGVCRFILRLDWFYWVTPVSLPSSFPVFIVKAGRAFKLSGCIASQVKFHVTRNKWRGLANNGCHRGARHIGIRNAVSVLEGSAAHFGAYHLPYTRIAVVLY